MYEYPKPPRSGLIRNFAQLSPDALGRMKDDLSLLSAIDALGRLASLYAKYEKKPPNVSDVCFFDAWMDKISKLPENVRITGFETENKLIADTYADLLAKRRELSPERDIRPTVAELFSAADPWLAKANIKAPALPDGVSFYASPASPVTAAAHGLSPIAAVGFSGSGRHSAAAYLRTRRNTRVGNALLLLLFPADGIDAYSFDSYVSSLVTDPDVAKDVLDVRPCAETGVAYALTDMTSGAYIDLKDLPERTDGGHDATDLISKYDKCALIACTDDALGRIASRLSGSSAVLTVAGRANSSGLLAVVNNGALLSAVDMNILRALEPSSGLNVVLSPENANTAPRVGMNEAVAGAGGLILQSPRESARVASLNVRSAISDTADSPFRTAYLTACTAYFRALASGAAADGILCGVSAELPADACGYGRTVAEALGLFRAQLDLCFRTGGTDISRISSDGEARLSFFAAFPDRPGSPARKFTGECHRVCLLEPKTDGGMPIGDDLRGLAVYLSELTAAGSVRAAYVFAGETLAEAIGAMSSEFTVDTADAQRVVPFGVIVETDEVINAEFIGNTRATYADSEGSAVDRPEYMSPVFRASPTVFIPEINPVCSADGLEEAVTAAGGKCVRKPYSNTRRGIGELSADMLGADITVFTSDARTTAELLANPRVAHAIAGYAVSKRLILVLGEAVAAFADAGIVNVGLEKRPPEPGELRIKLTDADSPLLSDVPDCGTYTLPAGAFAVCPTDGERSFSALTDSGLIAYAHSDDGLILLAPLGCSNEVISAAIRYFS